MIFTNLATAQSIGEPSDEICRSIPDAQAQTHRLKECDLDRRELGLLKEQLQNKNDKIASLEDKLRLKTEEGAIKDEMMKVKDQMIASQKEIMVEYKEMTDRAIKLAESKKSNIWETWGPMAIIAIVVVTIASVL